MSDRDILLHLLQHAEHDDQVLADMQQKIGVMHAELEAARPLLERARGPLGRIAARMNPWD